MRRGFFYCFKKLIIMPMTPCRAFGCPNLVTRKQHGFCDSHANRRYGWSKHQHKSAAERGYGKQWRKLRSTVLARDEYLCQVCLAMGIYTTAEAVDHIVNKAQGGTDALDNLQAICHACHKIKTQNESRQGRGG